ncbi:MAG: TetR/AcrR family transcriptional regulator [Bacteroidales bacterium]|jgi:AcrR family transcriptional regulator
MPRTEVQNEEIRELKRNLIMHTALDLFANKGYYTTSISRIAHEAKISKGLMYHYFSSKEELILAIMEKGINKLMDVFDPNKDGQLTDDEIEFLVDQSFRILQENTDYWKLYFATMIQPAVHKLLMESFKDLVPGMLGMMESYFRRKGVENPVVEAIFFSAVLDGVGMNYVMNPEGFPIEDIKSIIIKRFK